MAEAEWLLAEAALKDLVAAHPDHELADLAVFDLAQIAARQNRRADARRYLDIVLTRDRDPALREPARRLQCTLADDEAACVAAFCADFPRSPHCEATP
jgi:predicted Zn-dependent protease